MTKIIIITPPPPPPSGNAVTADEDLTTQDVVTILRQTADDLESSDG